MRNLSTLNPYTAGGLFSQYKMMQKPDIRMIEPLPRGYSDEIFSESCSINTNMAGLRWLSQVFVSHSIGTINIILVFAVCARVFEVSYQRDYIHDLYIFGHTCLCTLSSVAPLFIYVTADLSKPPHCRTFLCKTCPSRRIVAHSCARPVQAAALSHILVQDLSKPPHCRTFLCKTCPGRRIVAHSCARPVQAAALSHILVPDLSNIATGKLNATQANRLLWVNQ